MIIYPAIDLRHGRVVRLVEGDPQQETVFSEDPLETALRWKESGAEWLHIINLDGAFSDGGLNLEMISRLVSATGLKVQFGGGIRSLDDAARAITEAGVTRVVMGTPVVREPAVAGEAIQRFGVEALAVALDAKDGRVSTHGWQQQSEWTPIGLGQFFAEMGVKHALYTDINRDGKLHGPNVRACADLAEQTGLSVIASGGVSTLQDIIALRGAHPGITGAVIGKALYTGAVSLGDALAATREIG
jgi:phosphoribosylformimino-5-aminoimidazole carboxamide ribotide isomerase